MTSVVGWRWRIIFIWLGQLSGGEHEPHQGCRVGCGVALRVTIVWRLDKRVKVTLQLKMKTALKHPQVHLLAVQLG